MGFFVLEKYRPNLIKYANGLLKTRGFVNHKSGELDELSKDIVQNTYLSFHRHHKDYFVDENHLNNFLKLCLYRQYQESLYVTKRNAQYTIFKRGEFDQLLTTMPHGQSIEKDKLQEIYSKAKKVIENTMRFSFEI